MEEFSYSFHFMLFWGLQIFLKTNFSIEADHFQAAIAVDIFDLLVAAVDGEVVEFFGGDTEHFLEGVGCDAAEAGAAVVNAAGAIGLVKVNTPAVVSDHAEVLVELGSGQVHV
jgi:hypothetical protein